MQDQQAVQYISVIAPVLGLDLYHALNRQSGDGEAIEFRRATNGNVLNHCHYICHCYNTSSDYRLKENR